MVFQKGQVSHNKGKKLPPLSEEHKQKLINSRKGKKSTEEHKKKISIALKKYERTEEHKRKLKERSPYQKGSIPWNKGKPHSEQTKKKISERMGGRVPWNKGKEFLKGALNPNYGKPVSEERKKRQSECMSGEKSPNWKGGISFLPYCPKFNRRLKEKIRERDNHTCQLCGMKENGKKLDIHHINQDKENCNPLLISLCRSCHSKANLGSYEEFFINNLRQRGY